MTGIGGDSGSCTVNVSTETSCFAATSLFSSTTCTETSFPTLGTVPEQLIIIDPNKIKAKFLYVIISSY